MSETPSQFPEREQAIARINERGAEKIATAAQLLCRETVELAYDSVGLYLEADAEQHEQLREEGYPAGEMRGYFVLQDKFTAPREQGKYQRTFSTRLEPSGGNDSKQYMKLHVPVGDMRIYTYEMPPKDEVNNVFIEVRSEDGMHWYSIQKDKYENGVLVQHAGLYEYIPHIQQEVGSSVLSDQGIWQWINDRIPETGETINQILRQAINWDTVPQREIPIEEIEPDTPEA